jgi:hypothetical protein
VYWVAVRARSEIERVELADGPSDADAVEHDETDCEVVDRLMDLARSLTPTRDWTPLILEAGLDPADVVVTVMRRRLRRAAAVRAEHRSAGTSCENFGWLTVEENAAAAIAGLVGSFDDED